MIRFYIKDSDTTITTDWQEEPVTHGVGPQTAVVEITRLRQQYPNARISIERNTVIPTPDRTQVRFRIQVGQATYYSRVVSESESEALEAELRARFPKEAKISRG